MHLFVIETLIATRLSDIRSLLFVAEYDMIQATKAGKRNILQTKKVGV